MMVSDVQLELLRELAEDGAYLTASLSIDGGVHLRPKWERVRYTTFLALLKRQLIYCIGTGSPIHATSTVPLNSSYAWYESRYVITEAGRRLL